MGNNKNHSDTQNSGRKIVKMAGSVPIYEGEVESLEGMSNQQRAEYALQKILDNQSKGNSIMPGFSGRGY